MDFNALKTKIEEETLGSGKNPFGTKYSNLEGVDPRTLPLGSECTMLKWLDDNTPFTFEMFVKMTHDGATQGVTAYNADGTVKKEIIVPVYGGKNGKVGKQVEINNRIIIQNIIKFIYEN